LTDQRMCHLAPMEALSMLKPSGLLRRQWRIVSKNGLYMYVMIAVRAFRGAEEKTRIAPFFGAGMQTQ